MERIAQCHCGSLRATVNGEPDFVNVCHCKACQRRTGAVFHSGAYYRKAQIRAEGPSKVYVRTGHSGGRLRFNFCPNCGSSVYWDADVRPDHYGVAVGAFADPKFPQPTVSIWEEAKHPWVVLPGDVEHFRQSRQIK